VPLSCAPRSPLNANVEAVEKVPKQILGRGAEKSEVIECATINDLMLARGQVTSENYPFIPVRGFFYRLVRLADNQIMTENIVNFAREPSMFRQWALCSAEKDGPV
jgi:hypothetical protein